MIFVTVISLTVLFAVNGFTLYETADEVTNTAEGNSVDSENQAFNPAFIPNEDIGSIMSHYQ